MLVILDRDGVINQDSPYYIKSPDEWHAMPSSLKAIAKLNQAGWKVAVATNQSGIARGLYSEDLLSRIHQKLERVLKDQGGHLDAIVYCPHHPEDHCECRKPKPGMLLDIARRLGEPIETSYFIGDRLTDVQTARACGASPIFVLTGKGQEEWDMYQDQLADVLQFKDLAQAVDWLIEGGQ